MSAIVKAVAAGVSARFNFVGAFEDEKERLVRVKGVPELIAEQVIVIENSVSRAEVPARLAAADVGLSLIPDKPIFFEASPTKLVEYMGAGLAVLASYGIPMQEQIVSESGGGLLVKWDVDAIAEAITRITKDPENLIRMQINARAYAEQKLKYSFYVPTFLELIGETQNSTR